MAACDQDTSITSLDLPAEYEDLEGLLQTDLRALVAMLSDRARERLLLSRREYRQLQWDLWNNLTSAINDAMTPMSAECR